MNNKRQHSFQVKSIQTIHQNHFTPITQAVFSQTTQQFLTTDNNTVKLWDVKTLNCLYTISIAPQFIFFNPDGSQIIIVHEYGKISAISTTTYEVIKTKIAFTGTVVQAIQSFDKTLLLINSKQGFTEVYKVEGLELQRTLNFHFASEEAIISPDNKQIVIGGVGDEIFRVWDLEENKWIQKKSYSDGNNYKITKLKFSNDGQKLVIGDIQGRIRIWDATTWQLFSSIDHAHKEAVISILFSPDNSCFLTFGVDQQINEIETYHYSVDKYAYQLEFTMPFFFIDDENFIAVDEKGIQVYKMYQDECDTIKESKVHSKEINKIAISADGSKVATYSNDDKFIRVWDTKSKDCLATITNEEKIASFQLSADGGRLFGIDEKSKSIITWNTENGIMINAYQDQEMRGANYLTFSENEKLFLFGHWKQLKYFIRLKDGDSRQSWGARCMGTEQVVTASISKTSKYVILVMENNFLYVFHTKPQLKLLRKKRPAFNVNGIYFLNSDRFFVTNGEQGEILIIWDMNHLSPIKTFEESRIYLKQFALSQTVIANTDSRDIKIINMEEQE